MTFPYTCDKILPYQATLGVVVLQSDETLEQDLRRVLPSAQIATYVSRIPSAEDLTTDSIAQMKRDLPAAAALFPRPARFDAVAYGCTSGTTLIGPDAVSDILQANCQTRATTDPLTAARAAFAHLGATRIGVVSPYAPEIADDLKLAFEDGGLSVPKAITFGERSEAHVVRISAASLSNAARAVAPTVDAVFLSCTNLRTLDVIGPLEAELHLPVISSNICLLWHLAQLAGVADHLQGAGCLLRGGDPGGKA